MAEVDKEDLPTGHKSVGDGIVYNEWNGTAEVRKRGKRDKRGWGRRKVDIYG